MTYLKLDNKFAHCSQALEAGSYHSDKIAMDKAAQQSSTLVETGHVAILSASDNSFIWTKNLASCFAAVFIYDNGDIGLYHGFDSIVNEKRMDQFMDNERSWYACFNCVCPQSDKKLLEIQVFQKDIDISQKRALGFAANIKSHCEIMGINPPNIKINNLENEKMAYGVAVCYKTPKGAPVVVIGTSMSLGRMADTLDDCDNKDDNCKKYQLTEFQPSNATALNNKFKNGAAEVRQQVKVKEAIATEDKDNLDDKSMQEFSK